MAEERDDTTEFINKMDTKVTRMEDDALSAIKQRGETIGTATFKIVIGGAILTDVVNANWGVLNQAPENILGLVAGLALATWGLRDAGELPERFRKARELAANSRLLRAKLTNNIADAIDGIPFRRLEQSNTSALPPRGPRN